MSAITKTLAPTRFGILASTRYVFEQPKGSTTLSGAIIAERTMADGLIVLAANHGMLAFDFKDSALGSFQIVETTAHGLLPDEVTASRDAYLELQSKRLGRAVFVAACIYGVHAHLKHSSLSGPCYPSLDQIYNWFRDANTDELLMPKPDQDRFVVRLRQRVEELNKGASWLASIPKAHFEEGMDLADRLLAGNATNGAADNEALIVMNYQAAVLHSRQHAGASLALSAVTLEGALEEIFYVYGLVKGSSVRPFAIKARTCAQVSKSELGKLTFHAMTEHLRTGGMLDTYLADRIDRVRTARNALMNTIGLDVALEALRGLIKRRRGKTDELWRIAKVFRMQSVMRPYLEASV